MRIVKDAMRMVIYERHMMLLLLLVAALSLEMVSFCYCK
jgi:hypothetical protein